MDPRWPPRAAPPPRQRGAGVLGFFTHPLVLTFLYLLAAVGLVAVFGGWAPAPPKSTIVEIGPGQSAMAYPFEITPVQAVWYDGSEERCGGPAGCVVATLDVRVTAKTSVTGTLLTDGMNASLADSSGTAVVTGDERFGQGNILSRRAQDGRAGSLDLPPGLTTRMEFIIAVPDGAPTPGSIRLDVPAHTWRRYAGLLAYDWFVPRITASAALPITRGES